MNKKVSKILCSSQIKHVPGRHCGSSAIRDLMDFHGFNLSEAMCFGLGSGLGINYLNLLGASTPFIVHVRSIGYEEQFFRTIGVPFEWLIFDSPESASLALYQRLDAGLPSLLLTDIYYLPYFGSQTHFPGHAIIAWSRKKQTGDVLVTDTGLPSELAVCANALQNARFSTTPPFVHFGNMFSPDSMRPKITAQVVCDAIRFNASALNSDLPNTGLSALKTWMNDLSLWETEGDWRWTTRFAYQIIEKRGTGGGAFRKMYAEFLDEAASYDTRVLELRLAELMRASEKKWSVLAKQLKDASESANFPRSLIADAILDVMITERIYVETAITL
ncbi:MAG: BtrH N-terminal domain-containing protein [Gammaproteobacteria bacterium]|nr:BtrH N-terminal domain-containing protein [Gammaproteobacteria bacterium]